MNTFGQHLQQLREQQALSQSDLAARAGVLQSVISRYERGARLPDRATVRIMCALADALGVSLDVLLQRQPVEATHGAD